MHTHRCSLFLSLLTAVAVPLAAQKKLDPASAVGDDTVAEVVQQACALLLGNQEDYTPDRPVGRLSDDAFDKWQQQEHERLQKVRAATAGAGHEWPYEGVYRVRGGVVPPGYRVGGSAIVCYALLEAPGFDRARRDAVLRSVGFMLDLISEEDGMQPKAQTDYDVRGWGWTYALDFFLRLLETDCLDGEHELRDRVQKSIPHLIDCLAEGQLDSGGWNYAGPRAFSPFMTGPTLLALYRAKAAGHDVDQTMVERGLDALETGRGESRAFAYSGKLRNPKEPMQGACARSAVAELALMLGGRSTVDNLRTAIDAFFVEENWQALRVRKSQQGTHVAPYGVAPYYFFFGHTYAALAAEYLPEDERPAYRAKMRGLLWRTLEGSGWNDRIFPRTQSYSTAMAVLALHAENLPAVPAWQK